MRTSYKIETRKAGAYANAENPEYFIIWNDGHIEGAFDSKDSLRNHVARIERETDTAITEEIESGVCVICNQNIYHDGIVWIDRATGGDVCGVNGDNHPHQPKIVRGDTIRIKHPAETVELGMSNETFERQDVTVRKGRKL